MPCGRREDRPGRRAVASDRPLDDRSRSGEEHPAAPPPRETPPPAEPPAGDEPWDEAWLPQWVEDPAPAEDQAVEQPSVAPVRQPLPPHIDAALAGVREAELAPQRAAEEQAAVQLADWEEAIRAGEELADRAPAAAEPVPEPIPE